MNTFPMVVMVEDVAPRSRKRSFFIARLETDQDVYPRYQIWAKCDYEAEAIQHTKDMNESYQTRKDATSPTT